MNYQLIQIRIDLHCEKKILIKIFIYYVNKMILVFSNQILSCIFIDGFNVTYKELMYFIINTIV